MILSDSQTVSTCECSLPKDVFATKISINQAFLFLIMVAPIYKSGTRSRWIFWCAISSETVTVSKLYFLTAVDDCSKRLQWRRMYRSWLQRHCRLGCRHHCTCCRSAQLHSLHQTGLNFTRKYADFTAELGQTAQPKFHKLIPILKLTIIWLKQGPMVLWYNRQ